MIKKIVVYFFLMSFSLKSTNLEKAMFDSAFNPRQDIPKGIVVGTETGEKTLSGDNMREDNEISKQPLPARQGSLRKAKSAPNITTTITEPKKQRSFVARIMASAASFFGRNSRNNNDKEMVTIQTTESTQSDDNN